MGRKRVIAMGMVLLMMLSLLAGCQKQTDSSEETQETVEDIKVSEFRSLNWAPVFVAYEEGFFEEEGLNVEFVKYADGPIAFEGLHAGDSQFCLISQEPVLRAQEEGLESVFVGTTVTKRMDGFVGSKEITDISQLKGKAIYGGLPGSAGYSFVSSILREGGLDPEKDVTFVNIDYGATLSALESGQIQGTFINADNRIEMEKIGANFFVDTSKDEDAEKYLGNNIFPGEVVTVTKEYLEENPETVQKFVNAMVKGAEWIQEHSDDEVATSVQPLFEGMEYDDLVAKIELLRPIFSEDCYMPEEGENAIVQYAINTGVIQSELNYADIVDMTFVNEANGNK